MASKSKRRRRVLGASCILAALIIAGSSFAWFTSKDEVNNRLSANADYGVSIVESFAPPENWVPGQEVNKDVYAVNTGNVGAFVEETVSGKLTITTEVAKDTISANSVKLTAAERYAVEAGSYLAYKPATSNKELGVQVVSMIPDATNLDGYTTADATTDFAPDAAGLYVFRRSIGVNADTKEETFKYEAYFFDGVSEYYKATDLKVVPDKASYAGDNDLTDGNLKEASAKYVEEETKTIDPTDLTYDKDNNRLVASYDTGVAMTKEVLDTLAKAYDDALVDYEYAVDQYNAALSDSTSADETVSNAKTDLQNKNNALLAAEKALAEAEKALNEAKAAKAAADAAKDAADAAKAAAEIAATNAANALGTEAGGASNAENATAWQKYNYAKEQKEAKETALGTEAGGASNETTATAWQKYNYAKQQREAATAEARNAYLDYIYTSQNLSGGTLPDDKRAVAEAWLDSKKYEDVVGLGISNDNVNYNYHQLVVAEKEAERAKDKAAAELADAEAALARATQAKADAEAAKTAADNALADATTKAAEANTAATKAANDLGNEDDAANNDDGASAYAKYNYAKNARDAAKTDKDNAQTVYDNAVADAGDPGASGNLTKAKNNLAVATQKLAEAKEAYDDAINSANKGVLKININLADVVTEGGDVADKWQLLPNPVNGGIAYFYYTGILGAGETSAQLIDSVELDSSVTDDMFKRFDFDLNVALKSAQIAMANDGKTILTDAAAELDANATLVTPTSVDSVVNWTLK